MSEKRPFRVVIAGGGVAGLTLANSLSQAHIDYVLLEARDEIAPQVGASIGIFGLGGRILDQMGAYDDIVKLIEPVNNFNYWYKGRAVTSTDSPQLTTARTGYPLAFLDRQLVLDILYKNLLDKSRILLGKRVSNVDHFEHGIVAHCKDGSSYHGDVIVGVDGVHSTIRQEMWRHADQSISTTEKNSMIAEYQCLFGISTNVDGLPLGEAQLAYGKDYSFLVFCGKDKRIFWFYFSKMDKTYRVPNIPRFTKRDAEDRMRRYAHLSITKNVTFGDVTNTHVTCTLVPLEEAFFKTWTWGRFVTLGDSTHKMTPNIGQGGNAAIESAAALSNSLKRLMSNTSSVQPSLEEVKHSLRTFQKTREVRAKRTFEVANMMTRVEGLKGLPERIMALYVLPYSGDLISDLSAQSSVGAEKLEYLPDTKRSFLATMPYNRNYGVGHEESRLDRAMIALPILVLGCLCYVALGRVIHQEGVISQLSSALATGKLDFGSDRTFGLLPTYYGGLTWLDNIWRAPIIVLSPSVLGIDPVQRLQMISFLVDLGPVYLIWVLEGHRRTNSIAFARFPLVFAIAFQLFGIGSIGPVYYFLHYIQSPLSQFIASDMRLINIAYARTALAAIAIAYMAPTIAMYFAPSATTRLSINAIWQMFPVFVTSTHWILAKCLVDDPTPSARLHNTTADLVSIRIAAIAFITVSALVFNWIRFTSPVPISTILYPTSAFLSALYSSIVSRSLDLDLVSGMAMLLKIDYLSCFIASYAWLALLFKDLKRAEMTTESWSRLAAYAAMGTFLAGPGAVVGGAWLWREEILAGKKMAGAVVKS